MAKNEYTDDHKVVNGTYFDNRTNDKVCSILANYVGCRYQRVRVFYGNTESGKDWCECYDVIGYIGRSCGSIKIPLLIPTKNSLGGGGILDHCIVKITIDKRVVYEHPKYHCPIEARGNEVWDVEKNQCIFRGKSEKAAKREFAFFKGEYNTHNYSA